LSLSVVKFLTREGCHLCDDARPIVFAAVARHRWTVEEVDIDTDDALVRDYGLRVPVVIGPDGQVIAEGEIDARALARSLRKLGG
jgi:Glutaredoxin-like domain (DUF836)